MNGIFETECKVFCAQYIVILMTLKSLKEHWWQSDGSLTMVMSDIKAQIETRGPFSLFDHP